MIHYYTNREISEKLKVNLARWKRWSRAFLPPDPLGGMQSGYARQYLFKDLFKVYLGGHLISHHKLTVPEGCHLLADLAPWLKRMGFLDVNGSHTRLPENADPGVPILVFFAPRGSPDGKSRAGFDYLVHRHIAGSGTKRGHLSVRESDLNGEPLDGKAFFMQPDIHVINISVLRATLLECLQDPHR